jgi:hypothetical protein
MVRRRRMRMVMMMMVRKKVVAVDVVVDTDDDDDDEDDDDDDDVDYDDSHPLTVWCRWTRRRGGCPCPRGPSAAPTRRTVDHSRGPREAKASASAEGTPPKSPTPSAGINKSVRHMGTICFKGGRGGGFWYLHGSPGERLWMM